MTTAREAKVPKRQAALLRAVNVGTGRKLAMADLRRTIAEAGGADVVTYIQSGNAVFDHTATGLELEDDLERRLGELTGFAVAVMVRTEDELKTLVAANPFQAPDADPANVHVVFLKRRQAAGTAEAFDADKYRPERLVSRGREVYLYLPNGVGRAKLGGGTVERVLGVPGTARNWRTVAKLLELTQTR